MHDFIDATASIVDSSRGTDEPQADPSISSPVRGVAKGQRRSGQYSNNGDLHADHEPQTRGTQAVIDWKKPEIDISTFQTCGSRADYRSG